MKESYEAKDSTYYGLARSDLLQYVPTEIERVLEIGCGQGFFGASLKSRFGCSVMGIELVEQAAIHARTRLDSVLVGDALHLAGSIDPDRFDLIVLNDVLEHFADPEALLRLYTEKLAPDGLFFLAVPNVRHWSVVKALVLGGRWTYADWGILDRTHLRFYTRRSLEDFVASVGLRTHSVNLHIGAGSKSSLANSVTLGIAKEFLAPHIVVLAGRA